MHRLTIPEVIGRFEAYHELHSAWGSLHIVLDDKNVEDSSVQFCIEYAEKDGDAEGAELGRILLKMSKTQRSKIPRVIWDRWHAQRRGGEQS